MPAERIDDVEHEEADVGHMLATMNPEAAEAIDNPPPLPETGTMVVFKARAGFSRMHRTEFPAMVMGTNPQGTLELLVFMEADDQMVERHVPYQSHNQDHFCWRYRKPTAVEVATSPLADRVVEIEEFLHAEDKLGAIIEAIGKRVETIEAVLSSDEVEQLEQRIAALEAKLSKGK